MAKPEIVNIESILNNPKDKATLQGFIDEAVRLKMIIKDNNESIKAIKDEALEKIGLDPKMFNALVKIATNNNALETQSEIHALDAAIEILFSSND